MQCAFADKKSRLREAQLSLLGLLLSSKATKGSIVLLLLSLVCCAI